VADSKDREVPEVTEIRTGRSFGSGFSRLLEIDYESKEIIVCITEKILWGLMPINPVTFLELKQDFHGYEIDMLPERMARFHGDRNLLLSKN